MSNSGKTSQVSRKGSETLPDKEQEQNQTWGQWLSQLSSWGKEEGREGWRKRKEEEEWRKAWEKPVSKARTDVLSRRSLDLACFKTDRPRILLVLVQRPGWGQANRQPPGPQSQLRGWRLTWWSRKRLPPSLRWPPPWEAHHSPLPLHLIKNDNSVKLRPRTGKAADACYWPW